MRKTENRSEAPYEFRLNTKHYDAFVAALDAPAKPRPRLEKLLMTPSVLEKGLQCWPPIRRKIYDI